MTARDKDISDNVLYHPPGNQAEKITLNRVE